jgi:hypothetical protein
MPFFADFRRQEGHQFRLDTRIYLRDDDEPGEDDTCIAAIIGKNPGSANPTHCGCLARISLDGDRLLPWVRNRFRNAYERAGVEIPAGAWVRVWNLVYLCNPDLRAAVRNLQTVRVPLRCPSEGDSPPIVWFAWGPPSPYFREDKNRFLQRDHQRAFYFDMDTERVVASAPDLTARVKHTQGCPAEPVEVHLANLLDQRSDQWSGLLAHHASPWDSGIDAGRRSDTAAAPNDPALVRGIEEPLTRTNRNAAPSRAATWSGRITSWLTPLHGNPK